MSKRITMSHGGKEREIENFLGSSFKTNKVLDVQTTAFFQNML
jgi:hypothetical protein